MDSREKGSIVALVLGQGLFLGSETFGKYLLEGSSILRGKIDKLFDGRETSGDMWVGWHQWSTLEWL